MSLYLCLKQLRVVHINVFHRIQYIRLVLFYSVIFQSCKFQSVTCETVTQCDNVWVRCQLIDACTCILFYFIYLFILAVSVSNNLVSRLAWSQWHKRQTLHRKKTKHWRKTPETIKALKIKAIRLKTIITFSKSQGVETVWGPSTQVK